MDFEEEKNEFLDAFEDRVLELGQKMGWERVPNGTLSRPEHFFVSIDHPEYGVFGVWFK